VTRIVPLALTTQIEAPGVPLPEKAIPVVFVCPQARVTSERAFRVGIAWTTGAGPLTVRVALEHIVSFGDGAQTRYWTTHDAPAAGTIYEATQTVDTLVPTQVVP
jgi:hypothetical protein